MNHFYKLFFTGLLLMFGLWMPGKSQQLSTHNHFEIRQPGAPGCRLVGLNQNMNTRVPAPDYSVEIAEGQFALMAPSATINVTYIGFESFPAAQAAFQYAVDIWAHEIASPVPIEVEATFEVLDEGVLGSAGSNFVYRDFTNAPQMDVFYSAALANALAGTDLNVPEHDINASFNSDYNNWYFGTDGMTPSGQFDFVSVVLHELGHGLGFSGSGDVDGANGTWGISDTGAPQVYDVTVENGMGTGITSLASPSATLAGYLQSGDLFQTGVNAVAANGGMNVPIYAPATWNSGSSYSHWDETAFPAGNSNSLMTFAIGQAEAIHDVGDITRGLFQDEGWGLNPGTVPTIAVSTNSVFDIVAIQAGVSSVSSVGVSGEDLEGAVTATVTGNFEISLDGMNYASSQMLPATAGDLDGEPVALLIRIGNLLMDGPQVGTITLQSQNASNEIVQLFGSVLPQETPVNPPFAKDFEDQSMESGGWNLVDNFGPQGWAISDVGGGANSTSYFARMDGYDEMLGTVPNRDFLLSPPINFDHPTADFFSFSSRYDFGEEDADDYFKVFYVPTPEALLNLGTTTGFEELGFVRPLEAGQFQFSGYIDLSDKTGLGFIVFEYQSTDNARQWDIDEIAITDGPVQGVNLFETGGSTLVSESGTIDTVYVWLNSQPIPGEIVIVAASGGDGQATASALPPAEGIFTAANWNIPQVFTISAIDDEIVEGNHVAGFSVDVLVSIPTMSYDGASSSPFSVSIIDNDNPPVFTSVASVDFDENSTDVVLDVEANDGDGGSSDVGITYSFNGGADDGLFTIDSDDGELRFINAPDFENPLDTDEDNIYEVTVNADDGSLNTDQMIQVTVLDVNEGPACGVPTLSVDAVTGIDVDLSWTTFGSSAYELQYRIYGSGVWITESNLSSASRSFNGGELIGLQTYQVRVRPLCSSDPLWSSVVLFTTGTGPNCGVPTIAIGAISGTDVGLSWTSFGTATYELQYRIYGSGVWTTESNLSSATRNFSGADLVGLQTYQVRVRTQCPGGGAPSPWSSVMLFTTGAGTSCDVPTISVDAISGTDVDLSWTSFGTATYEMQYRIYGSSVWTTESNLLTAGRSFTGTELLGLQTYQVRVRTQCPGGGAPSAWSSVTLFTTGGGTNCMIPVPGVDALGMTTADISWTSSTGATYNLLYREYGTTVWTTQTGVGTASIQLTGLTASTRYQFRVRANCGAGSLTPYSSVLNFTTDGAGGRTLDGQQDKETVTEQLDQQEQITLDIYPNPVTTDMLTIRLSKAVDQIEMTMHSMEGRLIIPQLNRMGESQYQINTTGLSNGVYMLNISYDGNREIRRVMIRK